MLSLRLVSLAMLGGMLAACAGALDARKTIEGNSTGGLIPPAALAGKDPLALANAHCARWNSNARITFSGADAGGDVIFICEKTPGASWRQAPAATKQASEPAPSKAR